MSVIVFHALVKQRCAQLFYSLTIVVHDSDIGCCIGSHLHSFGNEVIRNGQEQLEIFHSFNHVIILYVNGECGSCLTSSEV